MKKLLFTLVFISIFFNLFAAVLTVSNDIAGGAQYSTLTAAYNAASPGDTLLLEGTNFNYDLTGTQWAKQLVVIGAGFNPDKEMPRRSRINSFGGSYCNFNTAGSGSSFYGIEFVNYVYFEWGNSLSNLYFENCLFHYQFSFNGQNATNIAFINCVFNFNSSGLIFNSGSTIVTGLLLRSCIINGYIEGNSNPNTTAIIDHCIFLRSNPAFNNLHNAVISNNIFMNHFPGSTTNATYLNNICAVSGTFPPAGGGGNTASGNIENTDPMLVSYTSGQTYSTSHDYHLQTGSPAIGAGSDGSDLGPFGGGTGFSMSGEPSIVPVVRSLTIQNPIVSPNGTLNVNVRATKPKDN